MLRRLLLFVVLAGVLAGCGASGHPATTATPTTTPKPAPRPGPNGPPRAISVTVLDGDLLHRVPNALVRVAGKRKRTNRHGVAALVARVRRPLEVTVMRSGYTTLHTTVAFRRRRHPILRVYQPDLQWPLYGANDARTQAQTHIKLRPPFRVVWSRGLKSLVEFPASVVDGVAYIGNFHAVVTAISMRDGKVVWRHISRGYPGMGSSPEIVGGEVVYHTMDGHVYVLDKENGHLLWSWDDGGSPIESSPIVRDGVDYFGAWNGEVYALDLRTHKLRWSHATGAKITSSASTSGGTLYIGDYAGRLWALSVGDGATRWVGQVNGKIYGTPAVAGGRVFVPSSDGDSLTAFSTSGSQLWSYTAGYYVYSSPAVWGGRVFFGSYDGYFYCVSASNGGLLWRAYAGGPISGAVTVVDGVAYAGSFAHRIIGIEAASGRQLMTFPHGEFVPVSGNGGRLIFHGYSRIWAVEPRRRRR
ncbi:MAG TPA: PQQ-binding-like beta-propeller repeat protein [Gaiellaceae bacterium]|nr:PQQ-binding-like beta-propeller repeat protein [Gaiellaceae bacterium]